MKDKLDRKLEDLMSTVVFIPDDTHLRLKAAFYAVFDENPTCDPADITAAQIASITGSGKVFEFWHLPGFKEWFQNSNELKQQINYVLYDAIRAAHEIIKSSDPKTASARIKAVELMFKIADKMPKQYSKVEYKDKKIGDMNEKQLREFIKHSQVHLLEEEPNEV